MWLMAVPAFYYQLRISVGAANIVERAAHETFRKAVTRHVEWGHELLALPQVPPEQLIEALQRLASTAEGIAASLRLDVRHFATEGE
jgi:hypothetical protein